ncbi:MAG: nucleotidyltransferase domain-containing protein [Bacteroidales bacterium]|nr:nucleotidyltransferase domain-containing protein [Bacteroidales bacterium]
MRHPEIIKTIQEILRRVAPDATAILFGSEARGDARPDSDIDVLILVDKEKISLQDRQTITFPLYDVELDTGIMISPKVFSKQVWEEQMSITPFYRNVMKEGILL